MWITSSRIIVLINFYACFRFNVCKKKNFILLMIQSTFLLRFSTIEFFGCWFFIYFMEFFKRKMSQKVSISKLVALVLMEKDVLSMKGVSTDKKLNWHGHDWRKFNRKAKQPVKNYKNEMSKVKWLIA